MKVGDYVRTDTGKIAKIKNIIDYGKDNEFEYLNYNDVCVLTTENDYNQDVAGCRGRIIKSSPNIIDLIEAGDYVNGELVYDRIENKLYLDGDTGEIFINNDKTTDEPIFTIVTKEQFESMEYKIGE